MNNYGSKINTMLGQDIYNLPMPVTPPANLSLASTSFTPRYLSAREGTISGAPVTSGHTVRFDRRDKPMLRGLGLYCNMADGLVDAMSSHSLTTGICLRLMLDRFFTKATGTISNDPAAPDPLAVTGAGTLFTRELCPGQNALWLDDAGNVQVVTIGDIASDTSLSLGSGPRSGGMYSGHAATAVALFPMVKSGAASALSISLPSLQEVFPFSFFIGDLSKTRPIRGLTTIYAATAGGADARMQGKGTKYLTDLTVGQHIRFGTGASQRTCVVQTVDSDTEATLATPATGTAGVATALSATELGWQDTFTAMRAELDPNVATFDWYTVTIDPAFADPRRLSFSIVAQVEHSYDLSGKFA